MGTIFCLFCKGVVNVKDEKLEKFKKHMEDIHEIYFEHEFILAGSFLKKEEKENIIAAAKVRIKKPRNAKTNAKLDQQHSAEILLVENVIEQSNVTDTDKGVSGDTNISRMENVVSNEPIDHTQSEVVTLRAVHYGDSDDEEDLSKHGYQVEQLKHNANFSGTKKAKPPRKICESKVRKSHKCEKCNKQFSNARKFKTHKMNFRNKSCIKQKATCDSCRRGFKSRQSLNVHKFKGACQPA